VRNIPPSQVSVFGEERMRIHERDIPMRRALAPAVLLAAVMLACGPANAADRHPPGPRHSVTPCANAPGPLPSHPGSLFSGGRRRTYRVYAPRRRRRSPALVLVLHGGGGNAAAIERTTGFDCRARRGRFVVAYPDGTPAARRAPRREAWNAGTCCGLPQRTGVDDVAFLRRLIDRLTTTEHANPRRVYVVGNSNGGLMAYRLACRVPGRIAAIGINAGTMNFPCHPARPVSLIDIHGTADPNIPYHGGVGAGRAAIRTPPIPRVEARWRRIDGCARRVRRRSRGPVRGTHSRRCDGGTAVATFALRGGGHGWTGVGACPPDPKDPCASNALDATRKLWRFFAAHPRRGRLPRGARARAQTATGRASALTKPSS
jgi:polyhydroxybutyrate depolymerase